MKFEVEKPKIDSVAQKVGRLAGRHLTLPVLSCIYFNLDSKNELTLKSTNLDIGIEINFRVKGIEEGKIAVPAAVLLGVISSVKSNNLIFESQGGNLKVSSGQNSAVIKCLPEEDFPSIPKLSNSEPLKIKAADLVAGLRAVSYSASTSTIKPELGSVYIYSQDNNLVFVATDSFRLAEKKIGAKINADFPPTLVPQHNVLELIKLFEDYVGEIEIIFEKNQAAFVANELYVVSRLVDGSFPDYKQIIPKSYSATAVVLKSDLLGAIKISNIFSDALNQVKLKVDVKNKSLNTESKNNEVGEYKESIKTSASGQNIELNFNSRYIADSMQSISGESIVLSFAGAGKPLAIQGAADKSFLYIVMPMNR